MLNPFKLISMKIVPTPKEKKSPWLKPKWNILRLIKFKETFLVLVELMANGEKDRVTKREKFIKPGYVQPCSS